MFRILICLILTVELLMLGLPHSSSMATILSLFSPFLVTSSSRNSRHSGKPSQMEPLKATLSTLQRKLFSRPVQLDSFKFANQVVKLG